MYQRGDVVSVPFPFTDLSETKLRPALIISNEAVNITGDVIIVTITSKERDSVLSIAIDDAHVSPPLPKSSFVNCHKVLTISTQLIQKKITQASPDFLEQIADNIRFLIGDHKFNRFVSVEE